MLLHINLAIFKPGGTFLDMRTIFASTIALANIPVIAEEVHASGYTNGSVNTEFLNVRTGPSTNFTILDVLQRQSNVTIKGQLLGYMGSTGDATGQHLHFKLHTGPWNINKTNGVNPLPYFRK